MDANLLSARICDLKDLCYKSNSPKFIGFLTSQEMALALKQFNLGERYETSGGYDGAERVMLGVLPDWCDSAVFPIKAITITYRTCDKLSHRDFLGALMALGISRETVGDILIENGRAVVFVADDVANFVFTQIEKIGNVGVELNWDYCEPLPGASSKQACSTTIASTRIDCVVAAICGMSRGQAAQKIADGEVLINSITVAKSTVTVKQDDKVTISKKGKYDIKACDEFSKKGRIILKYDKYV
ncbi:MAG: hypothetical protein IJE02_08070 [Clostridia bacterium]|nr:hypothetical protein [Clostridia bacterium]